jgi:hypothetical protein
VPALGAHVDGDVPEIRSERINRQFALNERDVVDAADGRLRIPLQES